MAGKNERDHTAQNGHIYAKNIHGFAQKQPQFPFKPKKALIVSKSSLLEYEFDRRRNHKKHFDNCEDRHFIQELEKHHINVTDLRQRHELQQQYLQAISQELKRHNIEWRIVRRREYTDDLAKWADFIISAGGDGTFLTAAKLVSKGDTPVIGINTDPIGSEGFLCLTGKSRRPADEVIRQFLEEATDEPKFQWMHRQRIRVTMLKKGSTENFSSSSSSSSIQQLQVNGTKNAIQNRRDGNNSTTEDRSDEDEASFDSRKSKFSSDDEEQNSEHIADNGNAHRLALNEVFIGESHAARVSYYDVQVDNGPMTKQKSSGMTICTGTGSTSWHYNINRLTEQNLSEIFTLMGQMGINLDREANGEMIEEICHRFNDKLKFGPELQMMAFSVRDPVFNATFPKTLIRGFAKKILLKSRCMHAHLILDGSTSIPFNRGAEVLLEIHPEDALRTAIFKTEDRS